MKLGLMLDRGQDIGQQSEKTCCQITAYFPVHWEKRKAKTEFEILSGEN